MPCELEVVHVVANADCGRRMDAEHLILNRGAVKDLDAEAARYRFADPTSGGMRYTTVSVFPTGRILCTGANSIERARAHTRRVLDRIGCPDVRVGIRLIVMTGRIVPPVDVLSRMDDLKKHWRVSYEPDLFDGMVLIRGDSVYVDIFPGTNRLGVRGPDMGTIHAAVRRLDEALYGG